MRKNLDVNDINNINFNINVYILYCIYTLFDIYNLNYINNQIINKYKKMNEKQKMMLFIN